MTKYNLSNDDLNNINKLIIFIKHLKHDNIDSIFVSNYRYLIINNIKKKYSYNDFYKNELLLNKLFWSLKNKLKPYVKNNKTKYTIKEKIKKTGFGSIDNKYVGSIVNSYFQYNQKNNKWYILKDISDLDKICFDILYNTNKSTYLKYYNNPESISKYNIKNIKEYYYFKNYPFPNVNPMFYNENKKQYWIKKINKMYFDDNDRCWYDLII